MFARRVFSPECGAGQDSYEGGERRESVPGWQGTLEWTQRDGQTVRMGLDGVELVMAFEEEFGLEIPDAAAEKFEKPADVIQYVAHALAGFGSALCPTQHAFHRLRRTFMDMGQTRSAIRLETTLSDLLPSRTRRAVWQRMRDALRPAKWPELQRPRWLTRVLLVGTLALPGSALFTVHNASFQPIGAESWFAALLFSSGCTAVLLFLLTKPFATEFAGIATVRELTQLIGGGTHLAGIHRDQSVSHARIGEAVRRITIEQLGLSLEEYGEDKYFVRDFGID